MIQENTQFEGQERGGGASIVFKMKGYLQNKHKTLLNIALTHALNNVSSQD